MGDLNDFNILSPLTPKWSRLSPSTGSLILSTDYDTGWQMDYCRVLDLINVHLFHDESNLALIHEVCPFPGFIPHMTLTKLIRFLHYIKFRNEMDQWVHLDAIQSYIFLVQFWVNYSFQNPSLYSSNRKRALDFVINECVLDNDDDSSIHRWVSFVSTIDF